MEKTSQLLNPLLDLHHAADAETQLYGSVEIVSTFGQPQLEYAALHKSCGIMDLPFRGVMVLTGRDRQSFLNGLVSNQTWDKETKQPMAPGGVVYSFLLNLKGRIVADMTIIELGDCTMIVLDATLVNPLQEVFEKYHFAEQVAMRSAIGELHPLVILGPQSCAALAAVCDRPEAVGEISAGRVSIDGIDVAAYRDDLTGSDGVCLLVPVNSVKRIWERITSASGGEERPAARPVGWAAFNSCRIEAGRALFGIDFAGVAPASAYPNRKEREAAGDDATPGVLPAETGALFRRAVSLSKCYVGQEIVARMHARQQVPRMIAGFKVADDALPLAGAPVLDAGQNQIGVVTSSTVSPVRGNASIGLAFLKKPHFATGTELVIPAEGAMRKATVVELPLR